MAATKNRQESRGIQDVVPPGSFLRLAFSLEPLKAFLFLITSFITGVTLFALYVTAFAVGISLTLSVIMAVVGIPIIALAMLAIPYVGDFERVRIRMFTGFEIGNPYRERSGGKFGDRVIAFLSEGALWRDFLYTALLFPIGLAQFVIAVVGFSVSVSLIAAPLIIQLGGRVQIAGFYSIQSIGEAIPLVFVGIVLFVMSGYVFVVLARGHAVFARWLIGPSDRDQLAKRVETLSETRSRMVGVSLEDRRNIERDIHDSTQPKLVSLAMNLGMAKEKLDSDPDSARELVDQAHREAREVLAEIRNLVRGLHPSILTDRGLEAAIRSLAGYCPVPVTIDVDLDERPPEAVETTAYYIVAESLTNVAKHSQATEAHVIVGSEDGMLTIDVIDDGVGGASPSPASGLSGLQDRAAALDGTLDISSPDGGPTRVCARLPCVS